MEPRSLLPLFLVIHIASAIAAFGPTFAFPIIGAMGGRDPAHVNFALRVSHAISTRLVFPVALLVGLSGLGLIWSAGWDVLRQAWLMVGIVLYLVGLGLAFFVAIPTTRRLIEATAGGPPPIAGDRPPGPPPYVAALVRRSQRTGMAFIALLLAILTLMVFKPTF